MKDVPCLAIFQVLQSRVGSLALPTNIRLSWKGLLWTNARAYYEHSKIMATKSFIEPCAHKLKQMEAVKSFFNKLERSLVLTLFKIPTFHV
jgi:hypothetical protein